LQAQHIRAWLNGLRTTCQCCAQGKDAARAKKGKARCCATKPAECCGQVAGTGTLRYLLRLVRAALQDAVEEELLARNVARQVKMPAGSIRNVTPWSADEARTFLETARHDRLYALWAVAVAIGLRRGEALGLRWVDADLVNGRVVITKSLSRVGANLALREVKTELSAASMPLPEGLAAILRRHRLDQFGDTQVARANTLGLVFTPKSGAPLEPRNVNRSFETANGPPARGQRSVRHGSNKFRENATTTLGTLQAVA
jgi:integrase